MKYKEINKLEAWDGDIVRVITRTYDDSIISECWHKKFIWRPKYYRIVKINNNLTACCRDHFGVLRHVNMTYNGITVYRKQEG